MDVIGFFRALKSGVLGVLEVSEKKGGKPAHTYFQVLVMLANLFQMLSFVTSDMSTSPWPSSLSPLETLSSLTNLRGYKRFVAPMAIQAAVWVALLWVVVFFSALAWGVVCFSKNAFPFMWPVRLRRCRCPRPAVKRAHEKQAPHRRWWSRLREFQSFPLPQTLTATRPFCSCTCCAA
jgi:hypothetical protein